MKLYLIFFILFQWKNKNLIPLVCYLEHVPKLMWDKVFEWDLKAVYQNYFSFINNSLQLSSISSRFLEQKRNWQFKMRPLLFGLSYQYLNLSCHYILFQWGLVQKSFLFQCITFSSNYCMYSIELAQHDL